jgi:ribonuclease R
MKKKTSTPKKKATQPPHNLHDQITKTILLHVSSPNYHPLTQSQLLTELELQEAEETIAKKIITQMIVEGKIVAIKKKLSLAEEKKVATASGTLRLHPRGFGFVIPDAASQLKEDVFIPKHLTDNAVDGDIVEIALLPSTKPEKGPEGKILNIVKRSRPHLAGVIRIIDEGKHMLAFIPLFGPHKPAEVLPSKDFPVSIGDRVILKVVEWGGQNKGPLCEISHIIGHISNASLDIPAAVEEYSLRSSFPFQAVHQAKEYGAEVSQEEKKNRLDLTKVETFTIDPETAKDFDDALSLSKDARGYHLMVHIADVAHYVPQGCPLDKEALMRGNSTYFPGQCIPMLPEELSNHLCSLRPDTERLCISVLMSFDFDGNLTDHSIKRSFIKSQRRFTYEEAKEILDRKTTSPHACTLFLMEELCLLLKKKRSERGSIDFALPEVVLQVDTQGEPLCFKIVEYDISHQLVEEFMLKANEVVAQFLSNQNKPLLYRVHEEPSYDNLEEFGMLARSLGFPLKDATSIQELQALFLKAKETPYAYQLAVAFIRSMKLATYSAENVGHFGLALEYYCHFTSPIRRYPDLVIQRMLFNQQDIETNFELVSLECSEKERLSFKAEMSVKTLKKLRLLKKYFDEDPAKVYEASISKVKPFGIYFEISPYMLEGFLHISELEDDYFIFEAKQCALIGERTKKRHAAGDKIQVILDSVDFILQESKWHIVGKRSPKKKTPPPNEKPRHEKKKAKKNKRKKK